MSKRKRLRDGFALLAVLWVIVGASALATAALLASRDYVASSRNRIDLTRATWQAEACGERARAVINAALRNDDTEAGGSSGEWWNLDRELAQATNLRSMPCEVDLRPVGDAVDINHASAEQLQRLFYAAGMDAETAMSLTDAVLDWRDVDDQPREFGAEHSWYQSNGLLLPRNGPLQSVREALWVRGFDRLGRLEAIFTVEPGRICLQHAPELVLASMPGMTAEAVARITEAQREKSGVPDLLSIADRLSSNARDSMLVRIRTLHDMTTTEPEAWLLTSRASVGQPPLTAVLELKLVRAGNRVAIARKRTWME